MEDLQGWTGPLSQGNPLKYEGFWPELGEQPSSRGLRAGGVSENLQRRYSALVAGAEPGALDAHWCFTVGVWGLLRFWA